MENNSTIKTDELKFRNLNAEEIEVRVGQVAKDNSWISLLLFQNSRVAMDLLDETVGKMNWKREHSRDNKNCTISIWDTEKKEWIGKEDTGVESFSDKEKGLASDSFKRSAVNWGIGRSLYSSPKMFLYGDGNKLKSDKYSVKHIKYDEQDNIIELTIINKKDEVVFTHPKKGNTGTTTVTETKATTTVATKPVTQPTQPAKTISVAQQKRLFAISNGNNTVVKNVLSRYGYEKSELIKMTDYDKICKDIENELTM